MNIGQNIMNLRKSAKLSQEQLAEKMGVTRFKTRKKVI